MFQILLIDGVLQCSVFNKPGRKLVLPSRITKVVFDVAKYRENLCKSQIEILGKPAHDRYSFLFTYDFIENIYTVFRPHDFRRHKFRFSKLKLEYVMYIPKWSNKYKIKS